MNTRVVPRKSWLDGRVELLMEELAKSNVVLTRADAEDVISRHFETIRNNLGVKAESARRYLNDDAIVDMAHRLLFMLVDEHPGAAPFDEPRTVAVPIKVVGRIISALAEATQVRLLNETPEDAITFVRQYCQLISELGQIVSDQRVQIAEDHQVVVFPPAILRRTARYLDVAAHALEQGGRLPGHPDEKLPGLANAFRADARTVRSLVDPAD